VLHAVNVLIVDDDPNTCLTFSAALKRCGLSVNSVGTGASAIAEAKARSFDLALIDLRLPDTSGTDVIRKVRAAGGQLPFILMSAFLTTSATVEAMRLGAQDVWDKPIWVDDLCRIIPELVHNLRTRFNSHAQFSKEKPEPESTVVQLTNSAAERWALFVAKACESDPVHLQ